MGYNEYSLWLVFWLCLTFVILSLIAAIFYYEYTESSYETCLEECGYPLESEDVILKCIEICTTTHVCNATSEINEVKVNAS